MPRLNMSEFHPLDHWPYTARCRAHHGGGRRHLRAAWDYRRREQLLCWLWRILLLCRTGRHRLSYVHTQAAGYRRICVVCSYRRLLSGDELEQVEASAFGRFCRDTTPPEST